MTDPTEVRRRDEERQPPEVEKQPRRDEKGRPRDPIVIQPTAARQGRIVLGPTGRKIWIGALVALVVLVILYGFVAPS